MTSKEKAELELMKSIMLLSLEDCSEEEKAYRALGYIGEAIKSEEDFEGRDADDVEEIHGFLDDIIEEFNPEEETV